MNEIQGARNGNHGGTLQSGSKLGVPRPGCGGRPPSEVRAAWRALGWRCIEELATRSLEAASISDLLRIAEYAKKYGGDDLDGFFPEPPVVLDGAEIAAVVKGARPVPPLDAKQFYDMFTHVAAGTFDTSDYSKIESIEEAKRCAQSLVQKARFLPNTPVVRKEFAEQLYAELERNGNVLGVS